MALVGLTKRRLNMSLPNNPEIWTISVELPDLGTQRIDIRELLDISEGYEEAMRSQPDRYAYIDAVKVELDALIDETEANFKAWQGKWRGDSALKVATKLKKSKATKDDLDSALHSDPAYMTQLKALNFLKKQSKRLSGWLTTLVQRERMLGHLAQREIRGLSSYTNRGIRYGSQADVDAEKALQVSKQKWISEHGEG